MIYRETGPGGRKRCPTIAAGRHSLIMASRRNLVVARRDILDGRRDAFAARKNAAAIRPG
jgi:hypothetical protein